jgi:zinc metalloprotease ZmpA
MRRTVRTTWRLAAAAALAAGTLGMQATTAGSQAARPQTTDGTDAAALRALVAHPAAALTAPGQHFVVTGRLVDSDGTRHVRLERTYHGLKVLGGDLVVHRGPDGAWRGVSQTLRKPVRVGTATRVAPMAARTAALAPSKATRTINHQRAAGKPKLVVDATSGTPRLAWQSRRSAAVPTARPAGWRPTSTPAAAA